MSRLDSDYVPARPHTRLSTVGNRGLLVDLTLLVSGTVCLNTSPPHLSWLSFDNLYFTK